jgi:lipoprotein signal peptidase
MLTFGRLGNVVDGLLHGGDVVGLLVGDLLWKQGAKVMWNLG